MNPCGSAHTSHPQDATAPSSAPGSPPCPPPNPYDDPHNPSLPSAPLPSPPPLILTGHNCLTVLSQNSPPCQASSGHDGGQSLRRLPGCCISPFGASDPGFIFTPRLSSVAVASSPVRTPSAAPAPTPYPYPAPVTPPSFQVSVIFQSPDPGLSPVRPQFSEDTCPDLECSICFSQFNNIFRCPKMLQCRHTFCLECLARINVKSAQPSSIQCPLCRGLTPLPDLGLPRLATDSDVLSYLPTAMQRVYSIRFLRSKGKLQVKRPSESQQQLGRTSLTSLRSANHSLDVGLPSPPAVVRRGAGNVGGALLRLTDRPACRTFLLTSVIMMLVLLIAMVIFLLTYGAYVFMLVPKTTATVSLQQRSEEAES